MEKSRSPRSPREQDPILDYLRYPAEIRDNLLLKHLVETLAGRNDPAFDLLSDGAVEITLSFYDGDTGPT